MAIYSPAHQSIVCSRPERIYRGTAPTMRLVSLAFGAKVAESWVEIQINDLSEFAGCKGKIPPEHITETARHIINDYGNYRITELMYFFYKFKGGAYGKFYGTVDPIVILGALRQFNKERNYELTIVEQERRDQERDKHDAMVKNEVEEYKGRLAKLGISTEKLSFNTYCVKGFLNMTDNELAEVALKLN